MSIDEQLASMKTVKLKLPHDKETINGFGYSEITTIFWFFGEKGKLLYHWRHKTRGTQTEYVDLPIGVRKSTYQVAHYDEKTSTLWLMLHDKEKLKSMLIENASVKYGIC